MKKVFAVLFFLFFFTSCRDSAIDGMKEPDSSINDHTMYSSPGDFDGDKRSEDIQIIKLNEKKYCLKLEDGNKVFSRELNMDLSNYYAYIQDINSDGREDFVLYCIHNGIEDPYVFTYDNGLCPILTPDILKKSLIIRIPDNYTEAFGSSGKSSNTGSNLDIVLNYTELDFREFGPAFISEGLVYSSGKRILLSISAIFSINKNGKIVMHETNIKQVKK